MRRPLIAGNWKMHGTQSRAQTLLHDIAQGAEAVNQVEFAVFPPFVYLSQCADYLSDSKVRWGAQTVSEHAEGAFTGEIAASMLVDLGCHYVIIGHSERRALYGESNSCVAQKCQAAFLAGLSPIICLGETLDERKQELTLQVVQEQLEVIMLLKDNCANFSRLVIAYEPVWAIGTGQTATPEQAQAVHLAIRDQVRQADPELAKTIRILYGGSVKSSNAKALFEMPDIDGALIGGASLDAGQFIEIGRLCNN